MFLLGRLDLTVDHHVLLSEYEALCRDDEGRTARLRLGIRPTVRRKAAVSSGSRECARGLVASSRSISGTRQNPISDRVGEWQSLVLIAERTEESTLLGNGLGAVLGRAPAHHKVA